MEESYHAFGRIDLLVNNAGVAPDKRADLLEASEDSFDRVLLEAKESGAAAVRPLADPILDDTWP